MLTSNFFVYNPLPEQQRTTPAGFRRGVNSKILVTRYNQETIKPLLSVQPEFNFGSGIIRGHRHPDGRLMIDHIISPRRQQLFGADIRSGTISVWEHQVRYLLQQRNSNERIVGIIGNGNLTQNPYFVAWFGKDGLLIRLQHEPVSNREYDCIVIDKNNRVTVEVLRFTNNSNTQTDTGWQAINVANNQVLQSTQIAFSGQRIVKNGQAMSRQELETQVVSGQFYDLRHVFRFPAVSSGGYWKDLALEQFYDGKGIDVEVVKKALRGEVIATRWQDLTDDENSVRKALLDKGYHEATNGKPGTYSISGDFVEVTFLDSIYCHNVLGVDKETGKLCSMQVTGWSNNVGATLQGLSQLAANVFQDAILLNNGGDVFFLVNQNQNEKMIPYSKLDDPNWTLVPSCENRYYIRAALLLIAQQPLKNNDIEVVKPDYNK